MSAKEPTDDMPSRSARLATHCQGRHRVSKSTSISGGSLGRTQPLLPVVSLFSGAGGLDAGVERSGLFRVVVATDHDGDSLRTLERNFPGRPTLQADITSVAAGDLLALGGLSVGDAELVIGGPPCTPFSKSGFWIEQKRLSQDPNASLLDDYVRMVKELRPRAFILENVQGLTYSTHRNQFTKLLEGLASAGYNPQWKVLLAAEHGVPQLRKRVFVIGERSGERLLFPDPTHGGVSERTKTRSAGRILPFVTAGQALGDMTLTQCEPGDIVEGTYAELAAEVPPGENYLWHTERKGGRNEFEWRSRYWTFLLKLDPHRPSSTIQAQPGPWVGPFHWENVLNADGAPRARRLRLPELKRLMTFPDTFQFMGEGASVRRQLGNAVPVQLSAVVADFVARQLGHKPARDLSHTHRVA